MENLITYESPALLLVTAVLAVAVCGGILAVVWFTAQLVAINEVLRQNRERHKEQQHNSATEAQKEQK